MKKIKKFVSMIFAFALVFALPGMSSLKVQAASPTTYFVFFDGEGWFYQIGTSTYDSDDKQYEADIIMTNADTSHPQNGDIIVVQVLEGSPNEGIILDMSNVSLSNVTVVSQATDIVVKSASIGECYILSDAVASINGNVTNAYVYDRAHVNFNNNVSNLYITAKSGDDSPAISVLGTVGYASYIHGDSTAFQYSNFTKGSFILNDDKLDSAAVYDQTGDSTVAATPVSTTAETSVSDTSTQTSSSASQSSSAVSPKTDEVFPAYVCLIFAPLVFIGFYKALKRN